MRSSSDVPTTGGERCLSVIRETEYKRLRFLWSVSPERTQGAQAQERGVASAERSDLAMIEG